MSKTVLAGAERKETGNNTSLSVPTEASATNSTAATPATRYPPKRKNPLQIFNLNVTTKYNYVEVIHKSILFYETQRSGKLPELNRVPWRRNSALQDVGANGEDLSGSLHVRVSTLVNNFENL